MKKENNPSYRHGMYGTRPYQVWNQMRNRCLPTYSQRRYYYDKGVKVCDRWLSFVAFWDDMKDSYKNNLTIDRIKNDEGYCKSNCRWVTQEQQNLNKSTNRLITYKNQTKPLCVWTKELGIKYEKTRKRLNRGWSIEDSFKA